MSPTSEREKRNVIDRASVLAGLSVALWERMRGANLRFGGGRVSTGARSKASVAGAERESRRWNCVPKALRELWERDGNETKNPDRDRKDPKASQATHVAQASPPAVSHASPLASAGAACALRLPSRAVAGGTHCATGAAGNSTGSLDDIPSRLRPHGTPPPRNLTEFSKRRRSTPLLCVRSSSSRTSNHARRFGPTA